MSNVLAWQYELWSKEKKNKQTFAFLVSMDRLEGEIIVGKETKVIRIWLHMGQSLFATKGFDQLYSFHFYEGKDHQIHCA